MTPEEIVERAAEVLAEHQRSATGMTSGSPDRCRCGADIYPKTVDYSDPVNWPGIKDITVRRDEAFARHQRDVLAADGLLPTEVETATYSMADSDEPLGKVRRYVTPWEVTP